MSKDLVIKIAALAITFALVWHVVKPAPVNAPHDAMHTITVSGTADRKVVPDEGHIMVNLNSKQFKLGDAKKDHDEKLKKLLAIADNRGVEKKHVRTQSSNVQPIYRYTYEDNKQQRFFEGYRVQTMIDITVKETETMGALMEDIAEAGFEKEASTEWGQLMSMHYAVSEPEKVRDEILADAVAAARAKAKRMADAAGASLGKVTSISEGSLPQIMPYPVPMMAKGMEMAADAAPVTPPAGEQSLNAQVSVSFELK